MEIGRNAGFAEGCNLGAAAAGGDLLVILNPDAAPLPGFGEAIRRPWIEERGWAAWQALVADAGATLINSAGNPVHFTGIGWAGKHGEPIAEAPAAGEVTCALRRLPGDPTPNLDGGRRLSGAVLPLPRGRRPLAAAATCAAARLASSRPRSSTMTTSSAPGQKWRWLERNRWAFLIRIYPTGLLALVMPGSACDRARPDTGLLRGRLGRAEAAGDG